MENSDKLCCAGPWLSPGNPGRNERQRPSPAKLRDVAGMDNVHQECRTSMDIVCTRRRCCLFCSSRKGLVGGDIRKHTDWLTKLARDLTRGLHRAYAQKNVNGTMAYCRFSLP